MAHNQLPMLYVVECRKDVVDKRLLVLAVVEVALDPDSGQALSSDITPPLPQQIGSLRVLEIGHIPLQVVNICRHLGDIPCCGCWHTCTRGSSSRPRTPAPCLGCF